MGSDIKKGLLTENFVIQQLKGQSEMEPRYFSDKNGEIDFVLQYGAEIIPVEDKGREDKSAPSTWPGKPESFFDLESQMCSCSLTPYSSAKGLPKTGSLGTSSGK